MVNKEKFEKEFRQSYEKEFGVPYKSPREEQLEFLKFIDQDAKK